MNRLLLPAPATKQEPPTEETAPELDISRPTDGSTWTSPRGGCCELNTEAHALLVEMGEAMGTLSAAESKEDARQQCRALEIRGVRQRIAVQIWRDYQQHINARMQYADPDSDARLRNADEVEQEGGGRVAAEGRAGAQRVVQPEEEAPPGVRCLE